MNNLNRTIHVAPKRAITKEDLVEKDDSNEEKQRVQTLKDDLKKTQTEILNVAKNQYKIQHIKSQWVQKTYVMEQSGIPRDAKSFFLELTYPATETILPKDFEGDTFSGAFNTTSSVLELFLLQKKIMGPCWLSVTNFRTNPISLSWCKIDITCQSANDISICENQPESPPIRVLSLALKTVLTNQTEIVVVSGVFHSDG